MIGEQAERVLRAIRDALTAFPGMRIGQLLENCLREGESIYYYDDTLLACRIEAYLRENAR